MFMRIDCWIDWLAYDGGWTSDKALRADYTSQAVGMDTPGFASPIRAFQNSLYHMRKSNDVNDKEQTFLDSLGVLDLDLSYGPDSFGLKAFDEEKPITRMLPGSGPCDLRLLLPDVGLGDTGFHDVVIENLLGTSVWRSRHVTPADIIGLRQRWPKAVFQVMRERQTELEDLRRKAFTSDQPAYRYAGRGYCPVCQTKSDEGLDTHMMCHHLALGQLWRCPVEWCAVWKGSVRECRDHFSDKHRDSETVNFDQVSKIMPAWTVPRDFWAKALRPEISGIAVDVMLFHESGRKLVHKYRVYRDPLPHPALREGRISKLISLANRAMVIAQLTQLRMAIPASGHAPGEVPLDCFPKLTNVPNTPDRKRVSFATMDEAVEVPSGTAPTEQIGTLSTIDNGPDAHAKSPGTPPGFRPFEWPQAEWDSNGDLQRDPGLPFVASWSARLAEEAMLSPPPLEPMSDTRCRLAREGPFPNERSQASLRVLGKGCLFRHTSYEWNDHAPPKGGLGVPLNHPRFLEWVGTPDTAWLLEMSPGHWCDTLSRDRALTAAMQLHKDACLMKSNLDVLDQYALALHGTASTILQRTIGGGSFPGAEVLTGAPGAHAGRISVQMEALGLWRPTMDPVRVMATRS